MKNKYYDEIMSNYLEFKASELSSDMRYHMIIIVVIFSFSLL